MTFGVDCLGISKECIIQMILATPKESSSCIRLELRSIIRSMREAHHCRRKHLQNGEDP